MQSHYQKLNKNLEEEPSYVHSGDFHYWEMRIRQRLLRIRGGHWWQRALLGTYRLLADFGESYKKLLFWLLASLPITAVVVGLFESLWGKSQATWQWCMRAECLLEPLNRFIHALELVFIGIVPSGFQRAALAAADPTLASKIAIILEGVFAVTVTTLLVMAIRRQFRR